MDKKFLARHGRLLTSLVRFLIRVTLQYRIGGTRQRWPKHSKALPFLVTLASAPFPLFLSPRWIPRGRTSTPLQLGPLLKVLLARPVTLRSGTLLHQLTSWGVDRKEGSGREDTIVKRTPQIGTYEKARKTGTASGPACGSNLLTARQTLLRPRTSVDTRHRSRTLDNMSKADTSNYGHTSAQSAVGPGVTKARGTTTESANTVMYPRNPKSGLTMRLQWKAVPLRITHI